MITFHSFLQAIRKQKHVGLDVLGMGLCSASFLSRIESGDRKAPYLLRECLMGRLGISGENFHEYLQPREYEAWRLRQEIISNFLCDETETAEGNIEDYGRLYGDDDTISRQFYLYVKAEIGGCIAGDPLSVRELYREAVLCSMGHLLEDFSQNIENALLSIQEYCVLVKYIANELDSCDSADKKTAGDNLKKLCRIMDKVEKDTSDSDMAAKIYAMAVSFYTKGIRRFFPEDGSYACEVKDRCFKAIAFLRDSQKTYFIKDLMEALSDNDCLNAEERALFNELSGYYEVIKSIYDDYNLPIQSRNAASVYALMESGAYAIGDILHTRRKMFGLSQKELCDNICTEKTLARMESGKCAVQDSNFRQLCDRLKLVPDYMHGEIVFDDLNTYEIYRRVKEADNGKNCDELKNNLTKLKDSLDMDIISNKQCWARALNNYRRENEEISDEEYCENVKKLLSLSVGNPDEIDASYVCFTEAEKMLLHNLALRTGRNKEKYINLIISELKREDADIRIMMYFRVNAFLLSYYASELGNAGRIEESDAISDRIIENGLRINSLMYISDNIYNKYWNATQIGRKTSDELKRCIAVSLFRNNRHDADFYLSNES